MRILNTSITATKVYDGCKLSESRPNKCLKRITQQTYMQQHSKKLPEFLCPATDADAIAVEQKIVMACVSATYTELYM